MIESIRTKRSALLGLGITKTFPYNSHKRFRETSVLTRNNDCWDGQPLQCEQGRLRVESNYTKGVSAKSYKSRRETLDTLMTDHSFILSYIYEGVMSFTTAQ